MTHQTQRGTCYDHHEDGIREVKNEDYDKRQTRGLQLALCRSENLHVSLFVNVLFISE